MNQALCQASVIVFRKKLKFYVVYTKTLTIAPQCVCKSL